MLGKVAGTVGVVVLIGCPVWAPQWGPGILGEIGALPPVGAAALVIAFFGAVAVYCGALQRTLTSVRADARTASPASVWWMFAIPYNFIEDFFIVRAVGTSLASDGRLPARRVRMWSVLGYGWCALQILSLFPGSAGLLGGATALPVWVAHWALTVRFRRELDRFSACLSPASSG